MLTKAAVPPYRKERLRTCSTNVRYCRGSTGMVAQMEKRRHWSAVRKSERTEERKSASLSVSPRGRNGKRERERERERERGKEKAGEHGVQGPDEQIMAKLHDGEPDQLAQEEPGQNTVLEAGSCRGGGGGVWSRSWPMGSTQETERFAQTLQNTCRWTGQPEREEQMGNDFRYLGKNLCAPGQLGICSLTPQVVYLYVRSCDSTLSVRLSANKPNLSAREAGRTCATNGRTGEGQSGEEETLCYRGERRRLCATERRGGDSVLPRGEEETLCY
ncbi:hypothetical protein JZ751_015432 [Albula glossodonta]|uniref:Uncharacterized protein n=1 Tax=Albula glossodonta TaxID=121402 RepID=A0A8T2N1J9_9TELE|nr:hypothetical protein JZ751_015432 [Albula glossodonta]